MTISNTQALAAEELLRTVLSSESPGELILIDANLRLLRQRPEAFLKGRGEEADLVGWGSPEAVALLLTPLLSLLSTFFMGFSKKLGEELAASAVAKRTKKPVVDEPARARRRAVRIFKKECLRLACTPRQAEGAAKTLDRVLAASPDLLTRLLPAETK